MPSFLGYIIQFTIRQLHDIIALFFLRLILFDQSQKIITGVSINSRCRRLLRRRRSCDKNNVSVSKRSIAPTFWILRYRQQTKRLTFPWENVEPFEINSLVTGTNFVRGIGNVEHVYHGVNVANS